MITFGEVTVKAGEDILQTIEAFVIEKQWKSVVVTNAIGSVKDLLLATPVRNELPLKIMTTPCFGAAEILTFTGEIMSKDRMDPQLKAVYPNRESPLFVHIHAACARAGGQVMGGGLWGGTAFRELRVFLFALEDEETLAE
ncbi:MAG: DNA-binding protein [Acidaminococcaceae bacterium]|nr:DNA-binding protein [Acidaminococcaceae bacterium]MBQ9698120.1 DNA-binding protein [Acidaminococcaceae bacterium]MBR1591186.1 DNA-binding protein [Acidaminococcaceae bacterium]